MELNIKNLEKLLRAMRDNDYAIIDPLNDALDHGRELDENSCKVLCSCKAEAYTLERVLLILAHPDLFESHCKTFGLREDGEQDV